MEGYVLKEDVRKIAVNQLKHFSDRVFFINELEELPPEPVKPAISVSWKIGVYAGYRCPVCVTTWDFPSNYCPYCGTSMQGVER